MTNRVIACALISATSWLVACGTDAANGTNPPQDGGAGSTQTGSGGGGGGQGGGGVSGGGNGGSALGGNGGSSGTAGSNAGGAGTGGTPAVDAGSLCDGKAKKSLPYNIMSDYRAVTVIGTESTFTINPNPDCVTAYPSLEAGADAASADSADETQTLALDDPDAGDATSTDVSVSDASTSDAANSDAGVVDAGPPPPACYEFQYIPDLCEAATCWAGVIFQPGAVLPQSDAAVETSTGICIAPAATMVEFMARANRDGARVKFGSIRAGVDETEFWLNITTQWAKYSVAIPANEPYNESASTSGGVWNGFSVVVEPQDHVGGTIISVKDVTWK